MFFPVFTMYYCLAGLLEGESYEGVAERVLVERGVCWMGWSFIRSKYGKLN